MFCTSCGTSVSGEHAFCSGCGKPTQTSVSAGRSQIEAIEVRSTEPARARYDAPPSSPYRPTTSPPVSQPQTQHLGGAPIYVTQQVQVAAPVMLRPPKSVGLAVCLGLLFGPFGLFYASVVGGIIMLVGGVIATVATMGVAAPFVWIACAVWGGIAASNYNAAAIGGYGSPTQINRH